ncbi:MAG: SidA/IucD/PvdA family monooxygenase [Mycobacteriaceae bacterium]
MKTLVILGAGPKSLAVAAKAKVLKELGLPYPRVIVIEANTVGANWLANGGWTDGQHRLGTSPEKDIGFPYKSNIARRQNNLINTKMMTFSWAAFLVAHGTYSEWIDRGRPSPQHHVWAKYLQWVAKKIDLELIIGTVYSVSAENGILTDPSTPDNWKISIHHPNGQYSEVRSDELMITGPGLSQKVITKNEKILSIAQFWDLTGRRILPASSRAAVIGGGETAGSALDELARHDAMTISVISPMATLYTRGESYFENSLFSDPTKWQALSPDERKDVIRRTDRGVFSVKVQDNLLSDNRIHHLQGRVTRAKEQDNLIALTLENDSRPEQTHFFDLVIDATGVQPLWFLDLFNTATVDRMELALGWPLNQERIELNIGYDLSLVGMQPKLYLPNLASMTQGPGFPNLSCLGLLSDRILKNEVQSLQEQNKFRPSSPDLANS